MNDSITARLYGDAELAGGQGYGRSVGLPFIQSVVSVLVLAALWATGRDHLLRMAIPAMAMLTGVALYFCQPLLYIEYSLWVWFLAPLVRRIVDWRFGFTEPNFVLASPLLVSLVAGLTLIIPSRRANERVPAAFLCCGGAILYGFIVGMALHPSGETIYGLFNWLCPLLFGLHLVLHWRQYDEHRAVISRTFLWGVLLLGLYGIYQYISPPAWDSYWLENVMLGGQSESFGRPEAFEVRVWSSLNSPGPFANMMMVGLLLLLLVRSRAKLPAGVVGYLSFLLSIVRTAWLSWFIGLFLILRTMKPRALVRICLSIVLLFACVLPFTSDPRVANLISDRVSSFTDLRHDESFGDRVDMYQTLLTDVIHTPFGDGLKNLGVWRGIAVDSGILVALFSLGWLGTFLFGAGILALFVGEEQSLQRLYPFSVVAKAIVTAILVQLIGGNIFVNVTGAMFWTFAGLYVSAQKHHSDRMVACGGDAWA
jgi:hypothetical protein